MFGGTLGIFLWRIISISSGGASQRRSATRKITRQRRGGAPRARHRAGGGAAANAHRITSRCCDTSVYQAHREQCVYSASLQSRKESYLAAYWR